MQRKTVIRLPFLHNKMRVTDKVHLKAKSSHPRKAQAHFKAYSAIIPLSDDNCYYICLIIFIYQNCQLIRDGIYILII